MTLSTRVAELRLALGGPAQARRKAVDLFRTLRTMADRTERHRRIDRLQAAGLVADRPTDFQLWLGAHHMLFGYILPSNVEFYEHYEQGHWWQQVIRVLDEPSAMVDPIGLGLSKEMIVSHLIQVVHTSAGYDVALLRMFDDGLDELRAQLEQLIAGTHPRQQAIERILEHPDYPQLLLAALDRYEADPEAHWRVETTPVPEGCDRLFDWGIETFGSPGRLMHYSLDLPETPTAWLRAWWAGAVSIPTPEAV